MQLIKMQLMLLTFCMSEVRSVELKTHQIHFQTERTGLRPGSRWGSFYDAPRPASQIERGIPLPHTFPPGRFRRLDLGVFAASKSVPNSIIIDLWSPYYASNSVYLVQY